MCPKSSDFSLTGVSPVNHCRRQHPSDGPPAAAPPHLPSQGRPTPNTSRTSKRYRTERTVTNSGGDVRRGFLTLLMEKLAPACFKRAGIPHLVDGKVGPPPGKPTDLDGPSNVREFLGEGGCVPKVPIFPWRGVSPVNHQRRQHPSDGPPAAAPPRLPSQGSPTPNTSRTSKRHRTK